MSDTILRKAHMSAITEISNLNKKIRRIETGIAVAECLTLYLTARLHLHGKPYKADVAVLTLAQATINAPDIESANLAMSALKELLAICRDLLQESITEVSKSADMLSDDQRTADGIVHEVLTRVDEKLDAYKKRMIEEAGWSEDDMEELRRAIEEKFGGEDSE